MSGCKSCRSINSASAPTPCAASTFISPGSNTDPKGNAGIGARVMIVGQPPGWREVEARRPFHAQSGTRLFQWLAQAGFEETEFRAKQYLTSVTKCFPGKAASGGGDRKPTTPEIEACSGFLEAQLRLVDPALVIPVGRLAIDVFLPKRPSLESVIGT